MPELPEVETYRRQAERVLGRRVARVLAPDTWYLKRVTLSSTMGPGIKVDPVRVRVEEAVAS